MESVLSSGQLSGPQKDELMEQVKQQIAVANAQELLTVYPMWFRCCVNSAFLLIVFIPNQIRNIFSENDGKMFQEVYN
jgi:hypothetical protein